MMTSLVVIPGLQRCHGCLLNVDILSEGLQSSRVLTPPQLQLYFHLVEDQDHLSPELHIESAYRGCEGIQSS